jgi:PKD repeat protein
MDTSIPPVPAAADFRSIVAGNPPLTVTFCGRSEGTILARRWWFGDGVAGSRAVEPVRTFRQPGVRQVALTVQGPNGESRHTATLHIGGFSTVASHDFEDGAAGWSDSPLDDAHTGRWERADPEGTSSLGVPVQPEDDTTAGGALCWTTGASAGASALDNSVHGGATTLRTPPYDLSACADPYVSYSRWYSNDLGSHPAEDQLVVEVSTDAGATWTALETVRRSEPRFRRAQFRLADHITVGPDVRFRFVASDLGRQSLVEAAIDDFEILDAAPPAGRPLQGGVGAPGVAGRAAEGPAVAPNPFSRRTVVHWEQPAPGSVSVTVLDVRGRVVRTLLRQSDGRVGARSVAWDGRADDGARVAAGAYIVRVDTGGAVRTRRVVFLGR